MLIFDRIKQRDDRTSDPLRITNYDLNGAPVLVWDLNTSGKRGGKYEAILYQYSRDYKIGSYRIGVVDQTSNTLDGSSTRIVIPNFKNWSYPERGTVPYMAIEGCLASHIGTPMTSGCTHGTFDTGIMLQKAYSKLSEPDLDVGNIIGELSHTIRMFKNPIIGIGNATRRFNRQIRKAQKKHGISNRLRRGNSKPGQKRPDGRGGQNQYRRFLDSAANAELTYRYGVAPLISDIEKSRSIINKLFAWRPGVRRKSAREHQERATSNVTDGWTEWNRCYYMFHTRQYGSSRGIAAVYYTVLMPYGDGTTMLGLDWYQIPRLAYNLLPYTFVLDWIVDLDTWLGAIQPKHHLFILGNSFSWKTEAHHELSVSSAWHYPYGPEVPALSRHVSTSRHYTRDKDLPMSGLPDINWPLSKFERSLDAVSLLWQLMPRPTRVGGVNFGRIG